MGSTFHKGFMIFDRVWDEKVPNYSDDVLLQGSLCKTVIVIGLQLAVHAEDLQILNVERVVSAWERLH